MSILKWFQGGGAAVEKITDAVIKSGDMLVFTDEEKASIESAAEALEVALKTDDKDDIEAKTAALSEASAGMAEKLYAEEAQSGADAGASDSKSGGDDAVDAEFEEVKDDK